MTRHRLDWFSLLSGLTLSAIAVIGLTGIDWDLARWVGPAALIGVGLLVLAAVVSSGRDADLDPTGPSPAPGDPDAERAREEAHAAVEAADHTTE